MRHDININDRDFFTLLRAGLWEKADGVLSTNPDWEYIYRLADKQKVQGIIAEGISVMGIVSGIPNDIFNSLITDRGYIVKKNIQVNAVQEKLCQALDDNGIPYVILKGQAVAQSYAKPEIRRSGDIDFLIMEKDFVKTNQIFSAFTSETEYHTESDLHHALHVDGVWIETHAMAKAYFTARFDRVLEREKGKMFAERSFGCYDMNGHAISIPNPEYTTLFLIGHILRHLTTEGISMKQLCDWVRYMYVQHDRIDKKKLRMLVVEAGICEAWKRFSVFAVEWLGLHLNDVLLYEAGHQEYGAAVWWPIKKVRELNDESKNKHIDNFWLHYLNGYKEFVCKNNYLWNISKKAFFERLCDRFASLPMVFLKKLFGFGGDRFHMNRFKS